MSRFVDMDKGNGFDYETEQKTLTDSYKLERYEQEIKPSALYTQYEETVEDYVRKHVKYELLGLKHAVTLSDPEGKSILVLTVDNETQAAEITTKVQNALIRIVEGAGGKHL